jgi:hypothetical protein
MAPATPQPARPSSTLIYKPNGKVHMRGGGGSTYCHYFFIDARPPSLVDDMLLSISKPTGIYDPTNIDATKKRKLDQISIGLDDFQLSVDARERYAIDHATRRERKRRMIDDFPTSPGRKFDEQQDLKWIYQMEEKSEKSVITLVQRKKTRTNIGCQDVFSPVIPLTTSPGRSES